MQAMEKLAALRAAGGKRLTAGLSDEAVRAFLASDPRLAQAIDAAHLAAAELAREFPALWQAEESAQMRETQNGFINFYQEDNVNPYVAIAASGPWLITSKGAVVHDSGGYGMLGFGHAPEAVISAMARPHVMANVMTPSFSHHRFNEALRREVGQTRGGSPYSRFLCLNSGSEAVSLAGRIADINTRLMTDPGGAHAGWRVKRIAMKGSFHGRTELPAMYSDSSRKTYAQHLASPRHYEHTLITIDPYDVGQLRRAFEDAEREHVHIEAMFLEPVMGEGNPGRAVPREFFAAARELTAAHGTLLLIDSIQAGLRAHGVLSVVDYPAYEGIDAPDMETYSKALNAGQYPLSVLAVNERAGALYRKGVYGNTMTSNPRAMDVASTVLGLITPELRRNIRERGAEFVQKLERLAQELPGYITRVQGSGLLVSCELSPQFQCYGAGSTEEFMRFKGYGVIHGGTNALRFTPPFNITSAEIDLVVDGVRDALVNGPRKAEPATQAAA